MLFASLESGNWRKHKANSALFGKRYLLKRQCLVLDRATSRKMHMGVCVYGPFRRSVPHEKCGNAAYTHTHTVCFFQGLKPCSRDAWIWENRCKHEANNALLGNFRSLKPCLMQALMGNRRRHEANNAFLGIFWGPKHVFCKSGIGKSTQTRGK